MSSILCKVHKFWHHPDLDFNLGYVTYCLMSLGLGFLIQNRATFILDDIHIIELLLDLE